MNKCTHVSNNHDNQFFKVKCQNIFHPHCIFSSNYCIITNSSPLFSYINNSKIVIRGSNPCQNIKKVLTELTSVCEVKVFGQVTVE